MKTKLISVFIICAVMLGLGACAVRIDPPRELTGEEEAEYMGFSAAEYKSEIPLGEYELLSVNIKHEYAEEVVYSSDNPQVASVDSAGRVDALKEGEAVITAKVKSAQVQYPIKVTKATENAASYSTAIVSNSDKVQSNKAFGDEKNLYAIIVNEYNCCVTVYTYNDTTGKYTVPVRAMLCSVGEGGKTPNGENNISEKAEWVYLSDSKYYRWATYIGDELMFQSAPYSEESADSLIYEEYNKIGTPATKKNIRLSAADAKWIYDNCNQGTLVKIVNSEAVSDYSPLGVPKAMRLTEDSPSLKWDPTDSTKGNPYLLLKPQIFGADDTQIKLGNGIDLTEGVTASDTCGNDITADITVDGSFDRKLPGSYVISYYATDSMGRTTRVDREITVSE